MRLVDALQSGVSSLASYLAAHVLLCLVPAFFVAGALSALVPKDAVTRWLGRSAPKWVAYPVAAVGGSLIAVCSCTVLPLFAGVHRKGAGLGPAVTFLFFAPAGNILALSYTGVALGGQFALARVVLSAVFGIGIGLAMASLFPSDGGATGPDELASPRPPFPRGSAWLLAGLVTLLLAGTVRLAPLLATLGSATIELPGLSTLGEGLARVFPADAARGEEGVTPHGLILAGLVVLLGLSAWRGLSHVDDRVTAATWVALAIAGVTLSVATLRVEYVADTARLSLTGRSVAVVLLLAAVTVAARRLDAFDAQQWLWESWRFVRQIAPLLLVGVFVVGVLRVFVRPEWVRAVAGTNSVTANLAGVGFGVFMYFPTLVEVPVAKMFLSLGMHPGPLLAYLMADPELSLQSILVISKLLGWRRTVAWVGLVAVFSFAAGTTWGTYVDGAGVARVLVTTAAWAVGLVGLVKLTARALAHRSPDAGGSLHAHQDPR